MWATKFHTRVKQPVRLLFFFILRVNCATSRGRSPVMLLGIFSEATDGNMCPGVESASKNEYQENSWG
jgi:hypothetical protein